MEKKIKKVCLLGCTGSVGESTLDVIRQHPSRFQIVGLACGSSIDKLVQQIGEFKPSFVSVGSESVASELSAKLPAGIKPEIFVGVSGHRELVIASQPDVLMASMSGTHGLQATLQAIHQNVSILGIANKEVLVMAGRFINEALKSSRTQVVPVDSEHSAIFQALQGNRREDLKKLILTASGGPFRTWPLKDFQKITPADALKHPNWSMGSKITVDSASMMNKGLEYIEAIQLFQVKPEQVDIWVHPQSVIHSLVEYQDCSFMAQLGVSDMRIPIAYALSYPERLNLKLSEELSLSKIANLNFEEPDFSKFPCLRLAMDCLKFAAGPLILNAANEVAVQLFLEEKCSFTGVPLLIEESLGQFSNYSPKNLEEAIELDLEVKSWTMRQSKRQNENLRLRSVSI